ncbi:MAG: NADP-dependent oxidoreductase [Myxococcales bacterium]|nr:NADP-dependent oxidoreductase [Myxococcales bacterium]
MATNLQIVLKQKPEGKLSERHFEQRDGALPVPKDGEVLLRTLLLSLDAANRAWMEGTTYRQGVAPGDVMHGYAICEVLESKADTIRPGTVVFAEAGWQQFATAAASDVSPCPDVKPLSHLHSIVGIAGKTAYHGLIYVAGIEPGETLFVSAAAGSVGSVVGQIGKLKGARVVGTAGSTDKCQWVVDELGFDGCINYKEENVGEKLAELCPDGVDVYFDNTGGPILQAALLAMKQRGRIACCGAVSDYDTGQPMRGVVGIPGLLVVRRLRMEGFIVLDLDAERQAQAERDLSNWAKEGKIKVIEDVIDGLENAPRGLVGLLAGENRGKRMIRVGPDPE